MSGNSAGAAGTAAGDAAGDDGEAPVYRLDPECTPEDVRTGERYHARVNSSVEYGVFVDLSEHVSGLVHESALDAEPEVGAELVVELVERRENGDLGFAPAEGEGSETVRRAASYDTTPVESLDDLVGETVHLEGEVVQVKQTSGPTIFQIRDGEAIVPCAAFETAGVRAFPEVDVGDLVHATGAVERREGAVQIEVADLEALEGDAAETVAAELEAATEAAAAPPDVDPLVEWPALEKLRPDLERVATRLRRAVLEGRPIRIRHHADGDGMCASVPMELALGNFVESVSLDGDARRHLLRRSPSKAPFYEMEDATRDLNFALTDRERHGQKLPLLLMIDNGSTEEDVPAYRALDRYDVPVVVVDHHHPDPEAVDDLLAEHVNPYLAGEDYRITAGMLCVELARLVDPDLTDDLRHVPAVAGLADRSAADAMRDYLALADDAGYDEAHLRDVSEALDFAAHYLRYDPGTPLVADVLDVAGEEDRHGDLVDLFAERSRAAVDEQLDAVEPHVEQCTVENGAVLQLADLEEYARRFTYPAPGKTTGEIHDRAVAETGGPVLTVGYGPDFAVLRSDGVRLDIPQMVEDLNDEFEGGGVRGGGHLVVGSIKFVAGMREDVLDALVDRMADAEIDESLGAGAPSAE
ncbi:MAG: DHH family phosphoesterase [Halobacteriaceae archaeon]